MLGEADSSSQPAGVGLSAGSTPVHTLDIASRDFSTFVKKFSRQQRQYFSKGLFVVGESFGGTYVPIFVSDLVREQLANHSDALDVSIRGIILANAVVDGSYSPLGHYEMFCTPGGLVHFNESVCTSIASAMSEAERLQRMCQDTRDPYVCSTSQEYGRANIYLYLQEQEVDTRRRSPYDCKFFHAYRTGPHPTDKLIALT